MYSKKPHWPVLPLAAICICCALLESCGHSGSGQKVQAAGGPEQTPSTSGGSCGPVYACAQKAVEAAQSAQQTAANTNKTIAALTQQIQSLQQQVQGVQSITSGLKAAQHFTRAYTEMATLHPGCNGAGPGLAGRLECGSAIHAFCGRQGFAGGFPQETSATELTFICVK